MLAARAVNEIVPHPPAPNTLEQAGLSIDLVLQLVLKTLHFSGELSGGPKPAQAGNRKEGV